MTPEQRIEYFMSEIARLSNQVVDLQNERDALKEQNAALAAQVEALRANLDNLLKLHDAEVFVKDPWDSSFEEVRSTLNTTPQHHLRELRAEAGRAGFVAGAVAMERRQVFTEDFNLSNAANQYADSIRQEK